MAEKEIANEEEEKEEKEEKNIEKFEYLSIKLQDTIESIIQGF